MVLSCLVYLTLFTQSSIDPEALSQRFWDMFIIDALIGNWDRHNANWEVLYNTITDSVSLAPVFDCGSCLYPQADEKLMQEIVSDKSKMDYRMYEIPTSVITETGKRVKYFNFLTSLSNSDCNAALRHIVPRIDMRVMKDIVFDRERAQYRHDIRNLQSEIKYHIRENDTLTQRILELEEIIRKKDECINLLLTYTELTEENMKKQLRIAKSVSDY